MSDENVENTEKTELSDRLLEIIEDELSSLNSSFIIVEDDKSNLKRSSSQGDGDNEDTESVSEGEISSPNNNNNDETTLQEKNCSQNEEECVNENTSTASKKNVVQNTEYHAVNRQKDKRMGTNNEEYFCPIPDRTAEKILCQVEEYFKDYNIFKNSFLLDHVMRNKEGYVSLRLVASFRKIRAMTRDLRQVAYSLSKSKTLEFNVEKNKIRRIVPVPKIETTSFGKTVMVFNLPQQNLTSEYLTELFSKFGTVVQAEIYDHSIETNAYHIRCLRFHREIASKIYGIVEFEKYDQVVNALKDEDGHLPKENEMKVVPLLPQIYKKQKRNIRFLKQYNQYPRRGYGGFRPRDDTYAKRDIPLANGDAGRNGKMNNGSYQFKRGYFRRSYRGRKPFTQTGGQDYSDGQVPSKYNGYQNKGWMGSRQLKANNSINIDRLYTTTHRKKFVNGYLDSGV